MRRIVAVWRRRTLAAAHTRSLTHDPLAAASEQRWARRERYAALSAQIAAARRHHTSGEEPAGPRRAAGTPHPPCGSHAQGSPDAPHGPEHRPDRIDAALARTHLFTRPQGDNT